MRGREEERRRHGEVERWRGWRRRGGEEERRGEKERRRGGEEVRRRGELERRGERYNMRGRDVERRAEERRLKRRRLERRYLCGEERVGRRYVEKSKELEGQRNKIRGEEQFKQRREEARRGVKEERR